MAIQFYNGEFLPKEAIKFSINDVGILRGYGIFDFMRAVDGVPLFLENYLDRFFNSARITGMEVPYSREKIESVIHELVTINGFALGYVKLVMTGGDSPDGFLPGRPNLAILNDTLQSPPAHKFEEGISLLTCDYTRDFPQAKSVNYVMSIRLNPQKAAGGHEDVLYHHNGLISEVSRGNVFFFKGGKLITNEAGILQGITRMQVLKAAQGTFETEVRDFTMDELLAADEMFMTGSNKLVMPVVRLDDHLIADGKVGANSKQMLQLFKNRAEQYVREKKAGRPSTK